VTLKRWTRRRAPPPKTRAVHVRGGVVIPSPLNLGDQFVPLGEGAAEVALGQFEHERGDGLSDCRELPDVRGIRGPTYATRPWRRS